MRSICRLGCLLLLTLTLAGCGLFRSASEGEVATSGQVGSIELSLIDRSTLKPAADSLHWNVRTYPGDSAKEQVVYDGNSSRPRLQLAEGWYRVEVQHDQGVTKHVFEIYPGVHQDMHLVRMAM